MIKKILISTILISTLLNAGNFSFNSKKNNTNESQCNVDKITIVTATGEAKIKTIAISNAKMFALADYINTKYSIDFQKKNSRFIKNTILDSPSNFTKRYKDISIAKTNNGNVKVKFTLPIKSNKICNTLGKLNNPSKKSNAKANQKYIIATGYGISRKKALNNAFKTAVEQYVGLATQNDVMMKNNELIKDEVLTASSGFIQKYDVISQEQDDGMYVVKINALVESQKLIEKIKSLNISVKSFDGKNSYARVSTKVKSKKDAEKILKKVVGEFLSTKSIKEMLFVNYKDAQPDIDNEKNEKISLKISYSLGIDYKVYSQKVAKLEQTFKNLGAKYKKRVDLPYLGKYPYSYSKYTALYIKSYKKVSKTMQTASFGFIKKYGSGYVLDIWSFPKSWLSIYPFNINKESISFDNFQINLELKDSLNNIISANIYGFGYGDMFLSYVYDAGTKHNRGYYKNNYSKYTNRSDKGKMLIIRPFLHVSSIGVSNKLYYTQNKLVSISDLERINNISIELEEQ